jgi:carboxyl-terminal processing protease
MNQDDATPARGKTLNMKSWIPVLGAAAAIAMIPAITGAFAQGNRVDLAQYDEFLRAWDQVRANYAEKVDDKTLMKGAVDGMLAALDPHSSYLDERGYTALTTVTEGNYGGLGLNVMMEDGAVKVVAPIEGSPGAKAGLKSGDYITHLNGKLIYGGQLDEAVDKMRGAAGTSIRLTILRPERPQPFDVTLTRAVINLPAVKWSVKDNVGILNVNTFSQTTTRETVAAMAAIDKMLGHRPLGYILDLRSNPGGLLDQAVQLSDVFLEGGEVVSQRGRGQGDIERYYASPGDAARGLPVIVLVDAGSASAAEIVAAALQDHHRALVMGERSFGKGSVQSVVPLSETTALRLTTARYYTPSGRSVQEGGIAPDVEVPQLSDPDYKVRPRLREADLRRHLINRSTAAAETLSDDARPDPRFTATPEQLKAKGIEDFQLYYALQTISRLGPKPAAGIKAGK